MASGRVSMVGPFRRKWGQASLPCLFTFSKFCRKSSQEGFTCGIQEVLKEGRVHTQPFKHAGLQVLLNSAFRPRA